MTTEKKIEEKYPEVRDLSAHEKKQLFVMMEAFQVSAQTTIEGGEELLKMCDGCAFKNRSIANEHPLTTLIAAECVIKEEPFYCHKRFNPNGGEKLCNGWINIMNNK